MLTLATFESIGISLSVAFVCLCIYSLFMLGVSMFIAIIPDSHRRIVERLGVRHREITHGLSIILPVIDRYKVLEWTEFSENGTKTSKKSIRDIPLLIQTFDAPIIEAFCHDRVAVKVDTTVRWCVRDPMLVAYSPDVVWNIYDNLRSAISDVVAKENILDIEAQPSVVAGETLHILSKWGKTVGISIESVVVQRVEFPEALQKSTVGGLAALAAQKQEHQLKVAEAKHVADVNRAKAESELVVAQIKASTKKIEAEAAAQYDDTILSLWQKKGLNIPTDWLNVRQYSEAWRELAKAPGVNKVVIPTGTHFFGNSL
jgi:regulator of protease activity HflC (stomatin/prohibitin superfamily)